MRLLICSSNRWFVDFIPEESHSVSLDSDFISTTAFSTLSLSLRNNTNGNKSKNAVASSTSLRQKTLSLILELKELASSLLDSAKRHLDRLH
ncbi:unnamed protein product [Camellia sinensis]